MLLYLQYLRGAAAMAVVYYHLSLKLNELEIEGLQLPVFGSEGVNVFFVLSGFIISYMADTRPKKPWDFLWDRIVRVVPLYWFYTVVIVLVMIISPNIVNSGILDSNHIVYSFLFIPYSHPLFPKEYWPTLIPGWTLNYEMYFYFIFFCSLFFIKSIRLSIITIIIGALVLIHTLFPLPNPLGFFGNSIVLAFLFGIFIAKFIIRHGSKLTIQFNYIFLVILIFMVLNFGKENGYIYLTIHSALLVFLVIVTNLTTAPINIPALKVIGDASYSLYLSHTFVISAAITLCKNLPFNALINGYIFILLSLSFSILIGVLSYKLIEEPMINFFKKKRLNKYPKLKV